LSEQFLAVRGFQQGTVRDEITDLVGSSAAMQSVRSLVSRVAPSHANVLILGESGTGKEVIARGIHQSSGRRSGPFVPVNCGAIPAELLESELFGHEKGAFTGAISTRRGRFELAAGGTLFLDEIGDMPANMQVKLLRVLQERSFERVGSAESIRADVRIVAATHQDLERRVDAGVFRLDLFYRLNVVPIEVAPLRERVEDIPELIDYFAARLVQSGQPAIRFEREALQALSGYRWPGNVRELGNLVERLAILFPAQTIALGELPSKFRGQYVGATVTPAVEGALQATQAATVVQMPQERPELWYLEPAPMDLKSHLDMIERSLLVQALDASSWVVARAAKRLMLRRTTLVEKMRKFGLQRDEGLPDS